MPLLVCNIDSIQLCSASRIPQNKQSQESEYRIAWPIWIYSQKYRNEHRSCSVQFNPHQWRPSKSRLLPHPTSPMRHRQVIGHSGIFRLPRKQFRTMSAPYPRRHPPDRPPKSIQHSYSDRDCAYIRIGIHCCCWLNWIFIWQHRYRRCHHPHHNQQTSSLWHNNVMWHINSHVNETKSAGMHHFKPIQKRRITLSLSLSLLCLSAMLLILHRFCIWIPWRTIVTHCEYQIGPLLLIERLLILYLFIGLSARVDLYFESIDLMGKSRANNSQKYAQEWKYDL